jgi:hypothetical protein
MPMGAAEAALDEVVSVGAGTGCLPGPACSRLDLSRKRLDWLALDQAGQLAADGAVAPDRDALATLGRRLGDASVLAVIESCAGP